MTLDRWDIFCRIVDNFGDIGVCWRLARQLAQDHGLTVRLWVDDLATAAKLIQSLDLQRSTQVIYQVEICHWQEDAFQGQAITDILVSDVVIEAFACELPTAYQAAMARTKPVWINLEYLSAESWVDGFHAQLSIQPQTGLAKYFFFPGFTSATGGLLREKHLLETRDAFQQSQQAKTAFWHQLGIDETGPHRTISLFCYPHAPVLELLDQLTRASDPILLVVPQGIISSTVQAYLDRFGTGSPRTSLTVKQAPFLSQAAYDQLLWACDFNFVRGEDSWIRAVWAGKPFIWQPYQQEDDAHHAKLDAFLDRYAPDQDNALQQWIRHAHQQWSSGNLSADFIPHILTHLASWKGHAREFADDLSKTDDLVTRLVIFCKSKV